MPLMRLAKSYKVRERFKASVCDGMGLHQGPRHGWLHLCEGTTDAELDVGVLERQMLPSR